VLAVQAQAQAGFWISGFRRDFVSGILFGHKLHVVGSRAASVIINASLLQRKKPKQNNSNCCGGSL